MPCSVIRVYGFGFGIYGLGLRGFGLGASGFFRGLRLGGLRA